jgi:Skp family chaperone for outer membrane proteins
VKRTIAILATAAVAALMGCNRSTTDQIGTVSVSRITANWPKFLNYQNQLSADAASIDRSNASVATKNRERSALQQRFIRFQNEVTGDVRTAAEQVASQKHLKLVVTREYVGFGGVDITPDVEKILKITELATPKP